MSRVTKEMRDDIVRKAVASKFKEREKAFEELRAKLADELYATAYGAIEPLARQLPKDWITYGMGIAIKCSGFDSQHFADPYHEKAHGPNKYLTMSAERPLPDIAVVEVNKDHPCYKKAQAVVNEYHAIAKEKAQLREKLRALLYSVMTTKQLRAAWPEGEPFFPAEVTHSTALVPITLTHEINQMLGLKSKAPAANQAIVKAALKTKA